MDYKEIIPNQLFTRHVECYWLWRKTHVDGEVNNITLPMCTFNFVLLSHDCYVSRGSDHSRMALKKGAYFIGQIDTYLSFMADGPLQVIGIRFKPFAFANIIKVPIFKLNNCLLPLSEVIPMRRSEHLLISEILNLPEGSLDQDSIDDLLYSLLAKSLVIDEELRAQLNFMMARHGSVQIRDVFDTFGVSKVTLRKHFINKVGLTPKKVSQIWKMNRLFQLKAELPDFSLTALCLEAGYYDQAHFIRSFRSLFHTTPRSFFSTNDSLVRLAHLNISRRFNHHYDPILTQG